MMMLAIDGGKPVRVTPLPVAYPGGRQYGREEWEAVQNVLQRKSPFRFYGPDPAYEVRSFEKEFQNKMGRKYALGVTSGTAALIVALKGVGVRPGDKVIVPAITFIATVGAVVMAGGIPVFGDVDESMAMAPSEIKRLADSRTKAVVTVALSGNPCRMDEIMREAKDCGLAVVEDVAQSWGSSYHGVPSGCWGDVGCFSLQLNKIISAGEGGAVLTNDPAAYERMVRYHDQGSFRTQSEHPEIESANMSFFGQNYRMSELGGAIARVQLSKLDYIVSKLRENKSYVKDRIRTIKNISFRRINDEAGDSSCMLSLLLPTAEQAVRWSRASQAENVQWTTSYGGQTVYMTPFVQNRSTIDGSFPFDLLPEPVDYRPGLCPRAEALVPCVVQILLDPTYTKSDLDDIVASAEKLAENIL